MPSWKKSFKKVVLHRKSSRPESPSINIKTKIGIFGDHGTGKSSIAKLLSNVEKPDVQTPGLEQYDVSLTTNSRGDIKCVHEIVISDIPWEHRIEHPSSYQHLIVQSECLLLVCSLDDTSSYDEVLKIIQYLKRVNMDKPIIVLANKTDIASTDQADVKTRFGFYRFVSSNDCACVEISANDQTHVLDYWRTILTEIELAKELRRECDNLTIERLD